MTSNAPTKRPRSESGFSLIEVLVGMAVLSVISMAVAGIGMSFVMQVTDGSNNSQIEATTAQWASMAFTRDVQGSSRIAPECAPGNGTRLITFEPSVAGPNIEYRVTTAGKTFGLQRVECGAGGSTQTVTEGLDTAPSIICDGSTCDVDTSPRVVSLKIRRSPRFEFTLDGVRRTTDVILAPEEPPAPIPVFVSLGGASPLTISGAAKLNVLGDAYLNNPGTTAANLSGSGSLIVTGDLQIQKGSSSGPVLIASGNPVLHVDGNGPSASQMNVCGWCDIRIGGTGTGTFDAAYPDPLANLPAPDTSGLATRTSCDLQSGYYVCVPGIYTGVFPPGGNGSSKFKMGPGNYILRGGFL
ncbi:MAG: prepilin-type N-terminal cleavage/methylation domain-containing protein, partial [Microthrixaceae bacterium]|nr:prepilin-type N-terminal cleavage/methylation domain-containing protein [Microthrixaceae bacterium]